MIEGTLAIILNLMAITVVTFIIANLTVSIVASLITQYFLAIQVQARKIALWLLVTLPWLTGLGAALLFLNGYISSNTFESELPHWHHMRAFSWLTWHGTSLITTLVFGLYILARKLIQLRHQRNSLKSLTSFSRCIGDEVFEIETPESNAFTTGFIHKKCYITSGMLESMTKDEVTVVLKHEKAHATNNDPLKKWIFGVFTEFFISSLAVRLKLHMTLAMEQAADNSVVDDDVNSSFIAATLIKAARLNALYPSVKDNEIVTNFGADALEQRIYFLLGKLNLKPVNKSISATLIILIFTVCLFSIDGVHHLVEAVFSH